MASNNHATAGQQAGENRYHTGRIPSVENGDEHRQNLGNFSTADNIGVQCCYRGKVECKQADVQHSGGTKMDCKQDVSYMDKEETDCQQDDVPYLDEENVDCEQDDAPYLDEENIDCEQDDAPYLDEENEDYDQDGVPYDRGWAWMVVVGNVINYALIAGYVKCGGVFFVELLRRFQAPASKTALLFAIRSGVVSLSGLFIMNALVSRLGCRKTVLIGAAVMSLSAILSSLANELILLICLQAVLLGIADAMLIPAGEVLAAGYFRKRRALALSFIKAGGSIGTIVFPPMLTYFLAQYGLRGALLLTGAVCLHSFPATLLLRPLSYFRSRGRNRFLSGGIRLNSTKKGVNEKAAATGVCVQYKEEVKRLLGSRGNIDNGFNACGLMDFELVVPDPCKSEKRAECANSSPSLLNALPNNSLHGDGLLAANIPKDALVSNSRTVISEQSIIRPNINRPKAQEADNYSLCNTEICRCTEEKSRCDPQKGTTSTEQVISDPMENTKYGQLESSPKRSRCARLVTVLDFSLFRRPSFCLFFAYFMMAPGVIVAVDYLPALCQQHGVSEEQVALLLSIIGGLDLFSRLLSGVLADLKIFPVPWMVATVLVILGLTYQCVRFLTSFRLLLLLVIVQGLLAGVVNCMHSVLILHVVGLQGMAKTLGFQYLADGAFSAALHPFLGYIRDVTGSYAIVYHVTGCCLVLAAVLLLAVDVLRQREEQKLNLNKENQRSSLTKI